MYITLELIWQLEEESPGARSAQAKLLREPLIEILKRSEKFQLLRIEADEMNVKGPYFISAVIAQIEAMERGESDEGVMKAIEEASGRSIRECVEILRAKVPAAAVKDGDQGGKGELNEVTSGAGEGTSGEYDFLQDMGDMGDMRIGMDFENNMETGEFGNWNGGSWL